MASSIREYIGTVHFTMNPRRSPWPGCDRTCGPAARVENQPRANGVSRTERARDRGAHLPLAGKSVSRRHRLLGQWQVGGTFTAQAGAPFTVNTSSDQANIAPVQHNGRTSKAIRTTDPKRQTNGSTPQSFPCPPSTPSGTQPRNAVIGPGLEEFDLSLQKDLHLTETAKLQFRVEAYNVVNHPNFNIPNRTAFTPNAGRIASAQDSRQLQLALKLAF